MFGELGPKLRSRLSYLTNFTEAVNTSTPNATVPVVSFTATNTATNVDAALKPKGTGAVLAQIPDNTSTGGNKRGTYAVDWQTFRGSSNQVASGPYSVVSGGQNNRATTDSATVGGGNGNIASGSNSAVFGGYQCTASGLSATAGGYSVTASGTCSFAYGESTTATATYSVGFGYNSTASGQYSYTLGSFCTANSQYSQAVGSYSSSRSIIGAQARGYEPFSAAGDCQQIGIVISGQTTDATPKVLTVNRGAASTNNQLTVQSNSSMAVKGTVVARAGTSGDTASWTFSASIKRAGASAAMVAACAPVSIAADAGASTWTLTVTADTTNNALAVTFTGEAAKNINVICSLDAVELVKA